MSIFEDFENKKKINMQDDPVELLKKVRVRDGNLITRRSGRHTQEILARYHQSIVQYQEYMRRKQFVEQAYEDWEEAEREEQGRC